ncbi:hypothetical protein RB594_005339 [Gaeumannomyces avenae]
MASTMAGSKLAQNSHSLTHRTNPPFPDAPSHSNDRDDWEDWSDEDPYMADDSEELIVVLEDAEGSLSPRLRKAPLPSRKSSVLLPENAYAAASRPTRLKSRARQMAQNRGVGIKVVTDMTKFRKQQQQLKMSAEADPRHGQFADIAALKALEGDQSQSSVGSWHWLKKTPTSKVGGGKSRMSRLRAEGASGSAQQDLSPSDRPIMIGLAFPSEEAGSRAAASPQSSLADTPVGWPGRNQRYLPGQRNEQAQMRSVWSPDTEDADSPRTVSTLSPQTANSGSAARNAPPVPAIPAVPAAAPSFRERQRLKDAQAEDEYDDNFTPVTLFEEDGSPILSRKPTTKSTKSRKSRGHARSPATSIGTPDGWWDHIRTPFIEQGIVTPAIEQASNNPFKSRPQNQETQPQAANKSADTDEWWVGKDTKKGHLVGATEARPLSISVVAANMTRQTANQEPSPVIASSSRATPNSRPNARFETGTGTQASENPQQSHSEKARILVEENEAPAEQPPPYSPPNKEGPLRYRAVFPPGHPMCPQFPPSPGPVSPGLANTMTSQGAINMTEVPLTPAADRPSAQTQPRDVPLPTRAPGTYPTGDQFLAAVGNSPAARVERQRQRHEKEDAVARKVGGFWRGRGCIPESGCYGRSGREGRKRRRVWLGVCVGVTLLIVLIVVLLVLLLPKKTQEAPQESIWLNLTNYPPVPTGVLTVVGADNSEAVTACVAPSTLWSCTLPKDQQAANKPYEANQPSFVIQIQFDNSTRQFWNVPDGAAPTFTPLPTGQVNEGFERPAQTPNPAIPEPDLGGDLSRLRRPESRAAKQEVSERPTLTSRAAAGIRALLMRDGAAAANPNFTPMPAPPSFQDMWFLGNTTDKIRSERKAGEVTPFFISFLPSLNSSAGPNMLARRGLGSGVSYFDPLLNSSAAPSDVDRLVPRPEVNADGTPAPARMIPRQVLQQPLRLFDRGLETEHYGFYTYFNKTIYVKSLQGPTNETARLGEVPADRDGGALPGEAKNAVVWGWTRFHVQIWTRRGNSTRLLSRDGRATEGLTEKEAWEARRPGTFPYPITVREDTHGGDRDGKGTVTYNITDRGKFDTGNIGLQFNNVGAGGEWVNPRGLKFNPSYGGIDGGTGGCKCAWTNFLNLGGSVVV